ncbi:Sec14 cytosolic factor [Sodiomyces alkalinus F11]|uniref:Sec14 cytosolic factor n=1 Tax=Sodiomyces alkalinus (strain CBS 110278 / VKM F-3762 / F11) TaxID=1314773 RepID=A0A3N2Q8B6_SODAK|nr:Sec14 cytosolic factor [Sodiomyces alkalinus F11]ROT43013.1 Sec14 cytosolic factor [Sodiomyces alkalinus F11]
MATDAATNGTAGLAEPVQPVPSNMSTPDIGYPHGHFGHLTDHQQSQLIAFKELLTERGLYKPGPPASHDDPLLLRYLRARRWVPADAVTQFADTEAWRAANHIDVLYNTIDLTAYDAARRLYPQWTGRRDRRGIPLYVFEVRHLDSKAVGEYEKQGREGGTFSHAKTDGNTPNGLLRLFALYENLTLFAMPLCTQLQDRDPANVPITMSTNIVDISGVSLRQFWNLKGHMQAASQLATAHYPETLDRIFIIGAPVFFSTVWGWIKRWFDPITVSKIFILSEAEVKPTLEAFIDPRNIPKKYGGELDFGFGMDPVNDPSWEGVLEWANGYTAFPNGPMVWRPTADGKKLECIGIGSENGKKRDVPICSLLRTWPASENDAAPAKANEAAEAGAEAEEEEEEEEKTAELTDGVQGLSVSVDEKEKVAAQGTAAAAPSSTVS